MFSAGFAPSPLARNCRTKMLLSKLHFASRDELSIIRDDDDEYYFFIINVLLLLLLLLLLLSFNLIFLLFTSHVSYQ